LTSAAAGMANDAASSEPNKTLRKETCTGITS
jgi:hypothetical protein